MIRFPRLARLLRKLADVYDPPVVPDLTPIPCDRAVVMMCPGCGGQHGVLCLSDDLVAAVVNIQTADEARRFASAFTEMAGHLARNEGKRRMRQAQPSRN